MGVLIVPLLHVGQNFLIRGVDTLFLILFPTAGSAGLRAGGEENFDSGIRQHHGTDVAAVHQHILLFGHVPLHAQQEGPHGRVCAHGRSCHAHLFGADGGAHVLFL